MIGVLFFTGYTACLVEPIEALDGETRMIYAEVCDFPEQYDDEQRVEIKVVTEKSEIPYICSSFRTLLYLPLTDTALRPGDHIEVETRFYLPRISEDFDRKSYQNAQGRFIQASSTGSDEELPLTIHSCEKMPIRYFPAALAERWKEKFASGLDAQVGGFMTSLLLGDRSELLDEDYINLKKSGLSHITAVSGMHLMILIAFVTRIFGRKWGMVLSVPLVLFFSCMAGNTPSVMRASIMVIAASVSFLMMDTTDSLTILSLSLMILLLHNPYSIANISLQLSYLSTLGLMLYADPVRKFLDTPFRAMSGRIRKVLTLGTTAISCSLCAMLFTMPVLLNTFGYVTLASPLSNLLVLGVVSLVFVSGLLFCLCPILRIVLTPVIVVFSRYILGVADFCGDLWYLIPDWNFLYEKCAIIITICILLVILCNKYSKPRFTLPILCVILGICICLNANEAKTRIKATIHAVGNGQMITIASGRDSVSLIDCGSGSNRDAGEILNEFMLWNDFTEIDSFIFTAVDKTHARAFSSIASQYPINQVILPTGLQKNEFTKSVLQEISDRGIRCIEWSKAGEYVLGGFSMPCSLIGGTDRKLGVRLETDAGELLILHSFTQKMLDEMLRKMPLCADILVLSPANVDDVKLLEESLHTIAPDEIIFPSGGDYIASKLFEIPTRNTYLEGDIVFYYGGKMV